MRSFDLTVLCLSVAGNMAAILEVDDNMGQTFLQVRGELMELELGLKLNVVHICVKSMNCDGLCRSGSELEH